mgnify:CR=1 FL=1
MGEAVFSFTVDEKLRSEFDTAAEARQRSGEDLLREYMLELVQDQQDAAGYDAWFRQAVRKGQDDVAAGRVMSAEDADKEMRDFKASLSSDHVQNADR